MGKRVILIDEEILTDDLLELKNILDESVGTIKEIRYGMDGDELKNAMKDIEEVSHVLKCLSEKKFKDSKLQMLFLEK